MQKKLIEKVSNAPTEPGVYLMKDEKGKIIYTGKAINLKKRLESYFLRSGKKDKRTEVLLSKVIDFKTIITTTEKEALILESNIIKRYKPRYNVILKDDKRYPSLRINILDTYPFISIVRKIKRDGSLYFGPYTSSSAVHQTLKVVNKTFNLRKCATRDPKKRSRPCLNFQMKLCPGPCCFNIDRKEYKKNVQETIMFLNGKAPDLIKKIENEMLTASKSSDFEKAASLRDKMFAIKKTLEKQVAVSKDLKDRDVIAFSGTAELCAITLLFVRSGFMVGTRNFIFTETLDTESEKINSFITQFYDHDRFIPAEILLSIEPEDKGILEDWFKTDKHKKIKIRVPQRGEKSELVKLALKNARKALKDRVQSNKALAEMMENLKHRLKMDRKPEKIECFDNSNISGTSSVAVMVAFNKGKPDKSAYRKYKIKSVTAPDDYACMYEALKRRFKSKTQEDFPDLLVVDGGKGQLNIAVSVLDELNLKGRIHVIGIAKMNRDKDETEDKIYIPERANPVNFSRHKESLLFLQNVRDEAHRFAVSFHRQQRRKKQLRSELDGIPGIGEKRKKSLLKHFGNICNIRAASLKELSSLPGMNKKVSADLKKHLDQVQKNAKKS